jgi:hypothetical protein
MATTLMPDCSRRPVSMIEALSATVGRRGQVASDQQAALDPGVAGGALRKRSSAVATRCGGREMRHRLEAKRAHRARGGQARVVILAGQPGNGDDRAAWYAIRLGAQRRHGLRADFQRRR